MFDLFYHKRMKISIIRQFLPMSGGFVIDVIFIHKTRIVS